MDLDAGSGRFSGDGRFGQKLDKMDGSGVLDILDVLDENVSDADSGPVLDMDKSEPGLEAGPGPEKVLDWENGRFWDEMDVWIKWTNWTIWTKTG